jgi:ankyrin repeat protein
MGVKLHYCSRLKKGDCKIVETLLGHGADVKAKYHRGRTALSYAAQLLNTEIVRLLLERGADPDEGDDIERTPASWMASTDRARDRSRPKLHWVGE